MLKVLAVMLGLVMVLMMSGVGYAVTYKEAFDAGMTKYTAANYVGARADFTVALPLATTGTEKSEVQFYFGDSYYKEKNYVQAKIEFIKVVEMADGHPFYKLSAHRCLGNSYYEEKNYPQAKIEYVKVLETVDGHPADKSAALKRFSEIVSKETTTDWKAHIKWLNTIAIGLGNTPNEQQLQKEIYSSRENVCMAQWGKSYGDLVKEGTILP